MTTGKTIALTVQTFVGKVISLLFNTLSRIVMAFLPRSKHLLISWLQLPSAVILEPKKIKSATVSTFPPSICHEMIEVDALILVLWMLSFKPAFHSPHSPSSRGSLVPLHFLPLWWCHLCIWGCWYLSWKSWFQLWFIGISHDVLWIKISRVTIYSLDIPLFQFWTSLLFHALFCYFLTCIQVSQEWGKVVWYSHILRIFHSLLLSTQSKALA